MKAGPNTRGWRHCTLGDILRRHNEIIHPGDRAGGEAVFVGLEHIESNTGRRIGSLTIDLGKLTGRKPTFRAGQIVYGYLRPYLNKVWIAEFDGCSSVDQFAFDVNGDLADTQFVAAFMRSETFLRRSSIVTTTGQLPRISIDEILAVEIDLPPLADQRRIAASLTAALAAVDRAYRAVQDRLAAAEALPGAYLKAVFGDATYNVRPLGDGLAAIVAGTSVQSLERPATDGEWAVLKVSAVSWGEYRPDESKAVPLSYEPKPHEEVRRGDLLISRCNTVELVGAVVLVRDTPPRRMLSDKTLRLIAKPGQYAPEYLEFALRCRTARRHIEHYATGTSYSMRNISQDTIRAIPVPTPQIEEQRRIAADLSMKLAAAERLTARAREELAAVEALPAALLRQAFGGT
jgi:type I restriction enzyme S subunit